MAAMFKVWVKVSVERIGPGADEFADVWESPFTTPLYASRYESSAVKLAEEIYETLESAAIDGRED